MTGGLAPLSTLGIHTNTMSETHPSSAETDTPPEPPQSRGVLGDGGEHAGRYNMALVRRAIRNDWPIPDELRKLVTAQMGVVLQDDKISRRAKIAASKVILTADQVNVRREVIDVQAVRAEMMPANQGSVTVAPGDNAQTQVNVVNFYLPSNGRD